MGQESGLHLIIGTAGHIDHGKTTLVRALTGVDTDRLPEEKRRGITIALGFAPLLLPSGRVGVIDVPGHERFVKTMVAGAGGIDLALLVVASDEGVMPQTREHLEILSLLGVRRGIAALTKIDRAPELVELAREDLASTLATSSLAGAEIFPVSATTGEGLEALRAGLDALVQATPRRPASATAFLPIDRVFTVKGFGTVVTGTLQSGRIDVGDELALLPPLLGRAPDRLPKVRGLQVFGEKQARAHAGQRVAVNLAGLELDQVSVGQVLLSPGGAVPSRRMTVRFHHLASHERPLRTGARGLVTLGTAQAEGGLTLLEADALAPGESGLATLRLATPLVTTFGRRFIWRGFESKGSAGQTIGGGVILDAEPPRRRRRKEATSACLATLDRWQSLAEGLPEAVAALAAETETQGVLPAALARRLGSAEATIVKAAGKGALVLAGDRWVSEAALEGLSPLIEATVKKEHEASPYRAALSKAELSSRLARRAPAGIVEAAARRSVERKSLVAEAEGYRLPQHRPKLELDLVKKNAVLSALRDKGLEPPTGRELEAACGIAGKPLIELLTALAKSGEVIHCGLGLHFETSVFEAAKLRLLEEIKARGAISTADAKAVFGISRKYLIPLLEAFDKRGITARNGELRTARRG